MEWISNKSIQTEKRNFSVLIMMNAYISHSADSSAKALTSSGWQFCSSVDFDGQKGEHSNVDKHMSSEQW